MSFSLIFHFYTAILVYSCIFLSDLVYSCLILFNLVYSCPVTVYFFQKQKLPYVQVTQLPKLNCWQVCWQSQEKNRRHIFWPAQSAALWSDCPNFVQELWHIFALRFFNSFFLLLLGSMITSVLDYKFSNRNCNVSHGFKVYW